MHFILNSPLYFIWGLYAIWRYGCVYIPHPSWHRLAEAFVTGAIIKFGYYCMHKVLKLKWHSAHKASSRDLGMAAGAAEYLEQ